MILLEASFYHNIRSLFRLVEANQITFLEADIFSL